MLRLVDVAKLLVALLDMLSFNIEYVTLSGYFDNSFSQNLGEGWCNVILYIDACLNTPLL